MLVYVENVKTIVPQTIQPMWHRGVGLIQVTGYVGRRSRQCADNAQDARRCMPFILAGAQGCGPGLGLAMALAWPRRCTLPAHAAAKAPRSALPVPLVAARSFASACPKLLDLGIAALAHLATCSSRSPGAVVVVVVGGCRCYPEQGPLPRSIDAPAPVPSRLGGTRSRCSAAR